MLYRILTFNTFKIQSNSIHYIWLLSISEFRRGTLLETVGVIRRILILNTLLYSFYLPFVILVSIIQVAIIIYKGLYLFQFL